MSDITDIKRGLADRAQSVAERLLPNGHKEGSEWRVGSIAGEPGQSLGVHLSGAKAGVWRDFNEGTGGDLLDLWCQVKGIALSEALDEAREFLGWQRPEPDRQPRRQFVRPARPKGTRKPQERVRDYLLEDRNLPQDVLDRYKVCENGNDIVFPFILPDGTLALVKRRAAESGAHPKPTQAGCEPVLFGWQAMPDGAREVVITEGEIDALSWAAYGYNALSVPFGGGGGAKQQWIENDFERMDRFERIYLALDMDKAGDEAADAIADRLGRHRCFRVQMPHKDGNECLVNGVPQADMDEAVRNAKGLDPEGLRRARDFRDEVIRLFWPAHEDHQGYRTPYGKLGDKLLFRPGELTLWSGASGAGKSQVVSDCLVDWIDQGSRACLSSLEMKPGQTLKRMMKQTLGIDRPTQPVIDQAIEFIDPGLVLYERVGKAGVSALLDVFDYARAKYGCDQFIIDSLMRLGIGSEDYEGQEKAVFQIVDWTISRNVHMHLVAHTRKGDKDGGAPQTEDIKGAMEIGANAFNIVTIWRNRKREDQLASNTLTDEERDLLEQKPAVILNVAKQRNGDFEGKIGLWFDQETYRYHSSYDRSMWSREYVSRTRDTAATGTEG